MVAATVGDGLSAVEEAGEDGAGADEVGEAGVPVAGGGDWSTVHPATATRVAASAAATMNRTDRAADGARRTG